MSANVIGIVIAGLSALVAILGGVSAHYENVTKKIKESYEAAQQLSEEHKQEVQD